MTLEEFMKILVPAALGAIAGYGAIRGEMAAMRAQIDMLMNTVAEMRRRMDAWSDSGKG